MYIKMTTTDSGDYQKETEGDKGYKYYLLGTKLTTWVMGSILPQTTASHNKPAHTPPKSKIKVKIIFKRR